MRWSQQALCPAALHAALGLRRRARSHPFVVAAAVSQAQTGGRAAGCMVNATLGEPAASLSRWGAAGPWADTIAVEIAAGPTRPTAAAKAAKHRRRVLCTAREPLNANLIHG